MLKKSGQIKQEKLAIVELRKQLHQFLNEMEALSIEENNTSTKISKLSRRDGRLKEDRKTLKDYEYYKKELIFNILLAMVAGLSILSIVTIADGATTGTLKNQLEIILPRVLAFVGLPAASVIGVLAYFPVIYKENKKVEDIISYYLSLDGRVNNKRNRLACKKEITIRINKTSQELDLAENAQREILNSKALLQSLIDSVYERIESAEDQVELDEMARKNIGYNLTPEQMDKLIEMMFSSVPNSEGCPDTPRDLTYHPKAVHHVPGAKGFGFIKRD
jgi:hypothetical protein